MGIQAWDVPGGMLSSRSTTNERVSLPKTPSGGLSPAGVLGARQAGLEERLNDERDGDVEKDKGHSDKPGNRHHWPQGELD